MGAQCPDQTPSLPLLLSALLLLPVTTPATSALAGSLPLLLAASAIARIYSPRTSAPSHHICRDLEFVVRRKAEVGAERGSVVYKQVVVLDMDGLGMAHGGGCAAPLALAGPARCPSVAGAGWLGASAAATCTAAALLAHTLLFVSQSFAGVGW